MFGDAPLAGLSSLLATIQQLYPNARVTSGYRGPDNPLTQRNPKSLHALGGPEDPRAVDVAPIPGVKFEDYVNSVRRAGVPIRQAFDEATHPFPWTTGPNWHLASGGAQVQPYYPPRKPRTLADAIPAPNLTPEQPNFGPPPQMAQMTLGDLAPDTLKSPGHKGLFPGKDWRAVLGILGDALTAYGGGQPVYARAMYQKQEDERQQSFDREKLNAMLEAKRREALQPPSYVQNALYFQQHPEIQQPVIDYLNATQPVMGDVQTEYGGPVYRQALPRSLPGKQVVQTGIDQETGRKVVRYSDGSIDYAD